MRRTVVAAHHDPSAAKFNCERSNMFAAGSEAARSVSDVSARGPPQHFLDESVGSSERFRTQGMTV
eukprot:SAG22_NODE_502_length_9704_cov_23.436439_2_plen_66_part_00